MSADVSDCIAMSEDGDWYAFPKTMTRGQVMTALVDDGSWWDAIHYFRIRAGFIHEDVGRPGYWHEVTDGVRCHLCMPCWIVRAQSGGTT